MRLPGLRALACVIALLVPPALSAQGWPPDYDPTIELRTLETSHFTVHFSVGAERVARLAAAYAETAHPLLVRLLGHEPNGKTVILIPDYADSANGFALATPFNAMELLPVPPDARGSLNTFENWLWQLLIHEYTHVLHIDTIRPPYAWVNAVFGKSLSPNGFWPRWYVEGLATWVESYLSNGGRLRSALHDMELRAQVDADTTFSLDVLSSPPLAWPRRDGWYLYGSRFVDHLVRRHGADAPAAIHQENAATIIPLIPWLTTVGRWQEPIPSLHSSWNAELKVRSELQRAARGPETTPEFLTQGGELRRSPRLSSDRKQLFSLRIDADRRPHVRALDLATGQERIVAEVNGDGALAVMPDGRLLLSQPDVAFQFTYPDELFTLDQAGGGLQRLTHGGRLHEPDVAKDGRIVVIRRPGAERTELVLFENLDAVRSGAFRVLHGSTGLGVLATPRWSPDGTRVVFTEHRGKGWDLRVLDLGSGAVTDLRVNGHNHFTPAWGDDGARILFVADDSGTYDIYDIYDTDADAKVRRLTRLSTGALDPLELDGTLYFAGYRAAGWDLAKAAPVDHPGAQATVELPGIDTPRNTDPAALYPPTTLPPPDDRPSTPYAPVQRMRLATWLPQLGGDARGTTLGAGFTAYDPAGRLVLNASAWWGLISKEPGFSASLSTQLTYPMIDVSLARFVTGVPGAPQQYAESQLTGRVAASWRFREQWSSWGLAMGWQAAWLQSSGPVILQPGDTRPLEGLNSQPFVTIDHATTRRFVRSISTEEGRRFSIDFRGGAAWTGSVVEVAQASAQWSEFLPVPFLDHHVVALRVAAGVALGDPLRRRGFGLGGQVAWSLVDDLARLQSNTRLLRGYGPNVLSGQAFGLGTLEYRFPIASPEWGAYTLPVMLRRVHGAVFVDAGEAMDLGARPFSPKVGVGGEVRFELTLGYVLTADLRLGYAHGLMAPGGPQFVALMGSAF